MYFIIDIYLMVILVCLMYRINWIYTDYYKFLSFITLTLYVATILILDGALNLKQNLLAFDTHSISNYHNDIL